MTKKKSVTMQEHKLPKAVREALGAQDEVLKKKYQTRRTRQKRKRKLVEH